MAADEELSPDPGGGHSASGHRPMVTGLSANRRDPGRVDVRVGTRRVATLESALLDRLGVRLGSVWTAHVEAAVLRAVEVERAVRRAVRILATRGKTSGELRGLLVRFGFEADVAAEAVRWLVETGLLNDRDHARDLAQRELRRRPAPRERLVETLTQRGVDPSLARQSVAEAMAGRSDLDLALEICREMSAGRRGGEQAMRRRVCGALARRGFDEETMKTAVNRVLGPAEDAEVGS